MSDINTEPYFAWLSAAHEISRYYSLRLKAVLRYQYKVEFVVKPLIVLALYSSVLYCMCCLFGFHLGTHINSDALHVALLSFTSVKRISISAARSTNSSSAYAVSLGCLSLIFGHMQTQSEGLNFYFEIAMYNKSHI